MQVTSILGTAGAVAGPGKPPIPVQVLFAGAFEALVGRASADPGAGVASEEALAREEEPGETKAGADPIDPALPLTVEGGATDPLPELPLTAAVWTVPGTDAPVLPFAAARMVTRAELPETRPGAVPGDPSVPGLPLREGGWAGAPVLPPGAGQAAETAVSERPAEPEKIPARAVMMAESGRGHALAAQFALLAEAQKQATGLQSPEGRKEALMRDSAGSPTGQGTGSTLTPLAFATAQTAVTPPAPSPPGPGPVGTSLPESMGLRGDPAADRPAGMAKAAWVQRPMIEVQDPESGESARPESMADGAGLRIQTLSDQQRTHVVSHATEERQARHVAHQLATALGAMRDRPTEILLDPEELGHVRMSLQTGDTAIAMFIQADRPETADLMRRHLDQLAQEFRAMGYQDVTFLFTDRDGQRSSSHRAPGPPDDDIPGFSATGVQPRTSPQRASTGALDLRL